MKKNRKSSKGKAGYKKYHKKKEKMVIKNIKLVLLLAVLYVSLPSLSWTEEFCRSVFNEISEKLKKVDINQYKGKEGYVRFVEELEGAKRMDYVFSEVSEVLGRAKMKELKWQRFQGTPVDFTSLKELLSLDVIEKYKGMDGYAKFSKEHFEGDMQKVYQNVSAVLGGGSRLMKQLDWQAYLGSVSDFNKLRYKILNEDGSIKKEYKEMFGYVSFAEKYFEGDMQKTYINVSAVLGGGSRLMKQLDWQTYHGLVSEFNELRDKILNKDGSIREEYKGSDGYALFTEKYCEGDMQKAYINVSAVLGGVLEVRKLKLGWKQFQGTVDQFKELKELFESTKREELRGEKGQSRVAREIFKGNKRRAYDMVSALREDLLGSKEAFKKLNWKK